MAQTLLPVAQSAPQFTTTAQVKPGFVTDGIRQGDKDAQGRTIFEGHPTPFREVKTNQIHGYFDADNGGISAELYNRWLAAGSPQSAPAESNLPGGGPLSQIGDEAIKQAWSQYVNGQDDGSALKAALGLSPTETLPTKIVQQLQAGIVPQVARPDVITGRDVTGLSEPSAITGREIADIQAPQLGAATLAEGTTVEAADTAGLNQIAAGQGPLADQVRAANALARMKAQQSANRLAAQAGGYERRGLRRAALLQGQEQAFEGQLKATETLADKATQATTKLADLDAQRKTVQAQLDSARREGDANRIQEMTKKLADLDLATKQANAEIQQANANRDVDVQNKNVGNQIKVGEVNATIEGQNANRSVDVQDRNIGNVLEADKTNATIQGQNLDRGLEADKASQDLALRAQDQEEKQRIERGRFRIEAQKAIEDSAKGLLNEANRQATLAMARRELALAEARFENEKDQQRRAQANEDRKFWAGVITNLATAFVPKPPAAARGGLIEEPTLVAEGQHDELVIPVTGVTPALRRALAVEQKPFNSPVPVGQLLKAALSAPQEPEQPTPMDWGKMVVVLAPGNNRARKVY